MAQSLDAIVVGSGPNGLTAALTLARAGLRVQVIEARDRLGGGTRTAELTLPGFRHDVCSAVHPLGLASPFLRSLPLDRYGVEWIVPEVSLAHPLDDRPATAAWKSLDETVAHLGTDGRTWRRVYAPMVENWAGLIDEFLAPLHIPKARQLYPYARFGALGLPPATWAARALFRGVEANALFAGMAAHAIIPLERAPSAAFGLMLGMLSHSVGWPIARGGSHAITLALAQMVTELGGVITTGREVKSLAELPPARAVLFDTTPRQMMQIAGEKLPPGYRRSLERFRYGPGVFKIDWALSDPVPWRDEVCRKTATLHLGGTLEEVAASERAVWAGRPAERPYVLFCQPSLFDETRAPAGKHVAWGYCHMPNGSPVEMTAAIEAQVERFAPGFGETILQRHTFTAPQMEQYNPNYIGGDINGGMQDLFQHFTRPIVSLSPWRTPAQGIYLCSSSTPPGGGVHGMCGWFAARAVLEDLRS